MKVLHYPSTRSDSSRRAVSSTLSAPPAPLRRSRAMAAFASASLLLLLASGCITVDKQSGEIYIAMPAPSAPLPDEKQVLRQEVDIAAAAVARKDYDTAERILLGALERRRGKLEPGDDETVSLLVLLAETHLRKGRFEMARSVITRALVIANPTGPLDEPSSQRSAHFRLGRGYEAAGHDADAEEHYYKGLQVCQDDPEYEDRGECNIERSALIRVFVANGRYKDAEPLVLKRVASAQYAHGAHDIRLAQVLAEAAGFYSRQGKYRLSQPLFARGLAIWTNVHEEARDMHYAAIQAGLPSPFSARFVTPRQGHFPFTVPFGLDSQATVLTRLNRSADAAKALELQKNLWMADTRAEQSALDVLAEADRSSDALAQIRALQTVGYAYFNKGRYTRAANYYSKALVKLEALWTQLDVLGHREMLADYLANYDNLAVIERSTRRYSNAVRLYGRALQVAARNLDPGDALYLNEFANLATVYREMGELQPALDYARRFYDRVRKARPPGSPDRAWALRNIGYVHLLRGDIETSRQFESRALAVWQQGRQSLAGPMPARQTTSTAQ